MRPQAPLFLVTVVVLAGRAALRAGAVVIALMLAGCSSGSKVVDMTFDEAKAELLAIQAEIASLVPDDLVVDGWIGGANLRTLLRCGDGLQYPSQTSLLLVAGDYSVYIDEAKELIKKLPGEWKEISKTTDHPRVQLVNSDNGMTFLVAMLNGEFTILSGSACFPEFEGYSPHKKY